ncbi:hypothetical protein I7I50_06470 [Histoplasma capsulatum G186AR]|uniref:Uncharacterized protein n=1 Tax=Ajellomyces capsulatus TaxID=5037 RepID=A0A8H7Z2K4_AJECA|nr:hypothetical protein I7I52_10458 [Histoplasma capsulatum]QSS67402.1 hypothetical protein I7I50_06470 [Histoplasma capsulatum G186AR]
MKPLQKECAGPLAAELASQPRFHVDVSLWFAESQRCLRTKSSQGSLAGHFLQKLLRKQK